MELSVDIYKRLPDFDLAVSFQAGTKPLGILGASGSGKSMTLRCIAGLATPDQGRIVLNGRVLFDSAKSINLPSQARGCGFLFQNYALFPHLTVAENIIFGCQEKRESVRNKLVQEMLERFNLAGLGERFPSQLSGGQQQRVALARALAIQPAVLLLDEPFSALDNHLRSQMEKQLVDTLQHYQGVTLFVTHNPQEVYRVCQDLLIMAEGKIIAHGPKEEIFRRPPTYEAAQITGCKNISDARVITDQVIAAGDWGCSLQVAQPLPQQLTHLGIRAHHLKFVDDPELPNTFPCWVVQTSESPHRMTLYLSLQQPEPAQGRRLLHAEVLKEKWDQLKTKPFPWLVQLAPEQLFLLGQTSAELARCGKVIIVA